MKIENNQKGFVQLWLRLEHTRRHLEGQYKRYCVRNILKSWFGLRATDDFIWEVCRNTTNYRRPGFSPASTANCCEQLCKSSWG